MKLDLSHSSGFKIALIVIVLYAIIATITYMAWS
jgi:hypothetical protein